MRSPSPTSAPVTTAQFSHGECGLTRFPANVEQITVEYGSTCIWLVARRNEAVRRFPMNKSDCQHLISLLSAPPSSEGRRGRAGEAS